MSPLKGLVRYTVLAVLGSTGSACSLQQTTHDVARLPQALRVAQHVRVETTDRWQLPASARLRLIGAPIETPGEWQTAAELGLQQVFDIHTQADYTVHVDWPAPEMQEARVAGRRRHVAASIFGLERLQGLRGLSHLGRGRVLPVMLRARDGSVVRRSELIVRPGLSGQSWHDAQLLERAFAQWARELLAS